MPESLKTVAVVGATGAAGSTLVRILEERKFPLEILRLYASERSTGMRVPFKNVGLAVHAATEEALAGAGLVFFAAGATVSRELAPKVAAGGGVAVDKSSAFRMDPNVPLVVPEVNAATLETHKGIVANPNCVAIPLTVALGPLHRAGGLKRITVATYQAATGAGLALLEELRAQERKAAAGGEPEAMVYPHVLHGNVVPGGWSMEGDDSEEERKIVAETRRVLDVPDLQVSVTAVRVPVAVGHSMAVWVELESDLAPDDVRTILREAPGVKVVDEPGAQAYPTPRSAAGQDHVLVGRIRRDSGRENSLAMFIAADNLRKGAATNAVQVAEILVGSQ